MNILNCSENSRVLKVVLCILPEFAVPVQRASEGKFSNMLQ